MVTIVRFGGLALLVMAFFFALGGVIAFGNASVWVGALMLVLAVVMAIGGWTFWGYQRARQSAARRT
jgi:hypothetical protein